MRDNNDLLLKIKENLPATPGILGKDEYFNSAVLIPLLLIDDEYHLLFEKRAQEIRQGGEICFPGGEFDNLLDNNFVDTAVRETTEELGISEEKIHLIGSMNTLVGSMGVTVDSSIGLLDISSLDEIQFDKTEVEKIFSLPLKYFIENEPEIYFVKTEVHPSEVDNNGNLKVIFPTEELNLPKRYHKPWSTKKMDIYVYKTAHGVIWGLTARLILEVKKILTET